ncbi:MAG: MBL fold metallo-hydrolase [Caldisericia bacterium]|jgi:L-ascorbate metabolism protein UlaG (beta-lactamase superfamily)|nr:MBL fold metallo-hydrolase [Caldisericia bacterium]
MKIKFLGHSCFLIEIGGLKVMTDPYDKSVPYDFPDGEEVDVVTISHDHFDHSAFNRVKIKREVLKDPTNKEIQGVKFKSKTFFHDEEMGRKRGKNALFLIEGEGIKILHCGDLGHIPNEKDLEEFKNIDILLLPVGGYYTIDSKKGDELIKILNPKIVIPMHYKTKNLDFPIAKVDDFLKNKENVHKLNSLEFELDKSNIEKYKGIVVFPF